MVLMALAVLAGCGGGGGGDKAAKDESIFDGTTTEAAVGESTTTTTTPASLDACSLVSKSEAEAVVGTALDDAVPARESCSYTGPVTGPTGQFEVYVGPGAKKILDVDRDLNHTFEPIAGAGDESYLEDGNAFVRKGSQWVALRVVRLDDFAVYKAALTKLAVTVSGRI